MEVIGKLGTCKGVTLLTILIMPPFLVHEIFETSNPNPHPHPHPHPKQAIAAFVAARRSYCA